MTDGPEELQRLQTEVEQLASQVRALTARVHRLETTSLPTTSIPPSIKAPRSPKLESSFGLTLVNRTGAITLAIGIIFFFKYAADNRWLDARARVILGLVLGVVLTAGGEWLRRRGQKTFGQGVMGCGLAIIYVALYAAHAYYQLTSYSVAFFLMAVASVAAATIAVFFDSQAIGTLAVAGGLLTPLLLGPTKLAATLLFSYLLLLNAGVWAVFAQRGWQAILTVSFLGTSIIQLLWNGSNGRSNVPANLFWTSIFFGGVWGVILFRERSQQLLSAIWLVPWNAFFAIVNASLILKDYTDSSLALFAAVVAVAHFLARSPRALYSITAHACLLSAGLIVWHEWSYRHTEALIQNSYFAVGVSALLAIYAVGLIFYGMWRRSVLHRWMGLALIGFDVLKLYLLDVWLLDRFFRVSAFVALGVALLVSSYLYSRYRAQLDAFLKN